VAAVTRLALIDSISLNPDTAIKAALVLAQAEAKESTPAIDFMDARTS
jgi:phosphoenolpyruvate synthase/pyruvate phosphate dikinase